VWKRHRRFAGYGTWDWVGLVGGYLAFAGWEAFFIGTVATFVLAGIFAVGLLVARRASRSTPIPFAPWMLLGTSPGLALGQGAWASYLDMLT
jgi:leader peptidase (prepilin peptidase)/N-methyltransferase